MWRLVFFTGQYSATIRLIPTLKFSNQQPPLDYKITDHVLYPSARESNEYAEKYHIHLVTWCTSQVASQDYILFEDNSIYY